MRLLYARLQQGVKPPADVYTHRKMHRLFLAIGLFFVGYVALAAHDVITTSVTWNREISRIVFDRCASCHNDKGTAFSLMTYAEARPWAVAIKEEVLSRRMPPWGAVKGFGDFRNDQALSQEQIELITSWVEGGVPEGNPKDLPTKPKLTRPATSTTRKNQLVVSGDFTLTKAFRLDGLLPENVPAGAPLKITAELPDGSVEPLLWLYGYKKEHKHVFLFRKPLLLPPGTLIRGIPRGASIVLLPA
jgi:mono/diheme cytochrome c family protein